MSKYILRKHVNNFTIVSNDIIELFKDDLNVLGLYVYLLHLPDNWQFYKSHLCKETKTGIHKLEKMLKKLCANALVICTQIRSKNGQFAHFQFDIFDLENSKLLKINELDSFAQPEGQNHRSVKTGVPFWQPINKTLTKDTNKKTKETSKSLCASKIDARKSFEEFWKIYPRKKNKQRAFTIWVKNDLHEKSEMIIEKLSAQVNHDPDWKNVQFIPHPTTYLNGERWEDEIHLIPIKEHPVTSAIRELKESFQSKELKKFLN